MADRFKDNIFKAAMLTLHVSLEDALEETAVFVTSQSELLVDVVGGQVVGHVAALSCRRLRTSYELVLTGRANAAACRQLSTFGDLKLSRCAHNVDQELDAT